MFKWPLLKKREFLANETDTNITTTSDGAAVPQFEVVEIKPTTDEETQMLTHLRNIMSTIKRKFTRADISREIYSFSRYQSANPRAVARSQLDPRGRTAPACPGSSFLPIRNILSSFVPDFIGRLLHPNIAGHITPWLPLR